MPKYNGGFIGHDGLDAPDAPTIGTPSAGSAQADIAFTAGTAGTTATTEFVATTNDGIGATGTSSPITITGLTNNTSYTARVYAKNSHGTSAASEASASFTPLAEVLSSLFSTHLYLGGVSTPLTINNGINLSGEGGLVWIKNRNSGVWHQLADTERGANKMLSSNVNNAEISRTEHVKSFTSTGFTVGNDNDVNYDVIGGSQDDEHVSWTFRKAAKFFDIVTYTGNGVSGRSISHNLNGNVGMILFKRTDSTSNWIVWHRSAGGAYGFLDATDAFTADSGISNPTTTAFTIESTINSGWNASGGTYVAYLFAHNNNDGGFGPDSEDIIKCGSYTGNGTEKDVDLGFEAQWVMIKRTDGISRWFMFDSMRGVVSDGNDAYLRANTADAENTSGNWIKFTPTGFTLESGDSEINGGSTPYIYMAIRRPDQSTPTVASEVFSIAVHGSAGDSLAPAFRSSFPVDMAIRRNVATSDDWDIYNRLTGTKYLITNSTASEANDSNGLFDYQNGFYNSTATNNNLYGWMWKRAKGYFDIVAYSGNGSTQNVSHNLGAVPEMMWIKTRDAAGTEWKVYHSAIGNNKELILNSSAASATASSFNNTTPTSSVFSVSGGATNDSAYNFIAFLFASVSGVCKIGTYTGNGTGAASSGQDIDCGFTNGAKMVILKQTSHTEAWEIYDTTRGLVDGNDYRLRLNDNGAQATNSDFIDPLDSGFRVVADSNFNGRTYIFYAIANDPS